MYIDAITLAALADEWRLLLSRARIDTIIQPTAHSLAFQCYAPGVEGQGGQNRWLNLSVHPQLARAHLTARKPTKIASEPPPFVMLLRKYLEGTRIETIAQPRWERVLEIVASHPSSPGSEERTGYRLILEIMGRMSNLILCNEQGLILGSIKHVGADVNRYRVVSANVPYVPPPSQQRSFAGQSLPRLEPATVAASQLAIIPGNEAEGQAEPTDRKGRVAREKLWQFLTRNLLGFSPLLSREAVYRAFGESETLLDAVQSEETWEELAWNIRELAGLYDSHQWRPQLVERIASPGAPATPLAFAAYMLEQYAEQPGVRVRQSPSLNVLVDDYYAGAEWRDAMSSVRAPIKKVLQSQCDRCKRKAEILQEELAATEDARRYRLQAELLLAHQHEVTQGPSSIELENYYAAEGEPPTLKISLDPRFDAVGNANRLFNKYHKLRRALVLIPEQIEQNAAELATLEQFLADLDLAENPAEVALVKAEVQAAKYMRGKPVEKRPKPSAKGKGKPGKGKPALPGGGVPLYVQSKEGFTILIGKNSRQNEEVTFHQATGGDLWLHARGVPGAHVIIKAGGREIPRATTEQAAALAAYYSQARGSTSVPVDYTFQRHVHHMKNGGPGMVIYEREKTIYAEPALIDTEVARQR